MKTSSLLWALLLFPLSAFAQQLSLDDYIHEGLDQNLTVRQHRIDLSYNQEQVNEARGGFLPSLNLDTRFTRAEGGRAIDFPVGDLLNPAYGAINDLLAAQGQPAAFPAVDNQSISFTRRQEQETRLRLVQPLFHPAIRQNVNIRSSLAEAGQSSFQATRRQLVAEIKTAYFTYLRAVHAVEIFQATEHLVAEHVRVNERLFTHGTVTKDAVYRAEAEVSTVEQNLAHASTQRDLAASHFNVLLNRPLNTPIERIPLDKLLPEAERIFLLAANTPSQFFTPDDFAALALSQREEVAQLSFATQAAGAQVSLARSSYLPNISMVLDYGLQGSNYAISSKADFFSASVVLQWNLFNGFRDRAKVEQARLQQRRLETQQLDLQNQIQLQVQDAFNQVRVARRSIQTAEDRMESASHSFRLMNRKYEEGMASQVDFIDARTTLTSAELNLALTRFDLLLHHAELERVSALYPLP